jgi:hypothetical protein
LYPHYHAPACCAIYASLVQSHADAPALPHSRSAPFLVRMIFPLNWADSDRGNHDRARMLDD